MYKMSQYRVKQKGLYSSWNSLYLHCEIMLRYRIEFSFNIHCVAVILNNMIIFAWVILAALSQWITILLAIHFMDHIQFNPLIIY